MKKNRAISDLGVAAYIFMHDYKVLGRRAKEIVFLIEEPKNDNQFDQLTLDYLSSEFHRFDACIMSLKKIGDFPFENKNARHVTDLGAAAYILMHKYRLLGRKGKNIFFEVEIDNNDKFDELSLDYISSEFHRFDSCLMSLKKINEYISNQG